MYFLMMLLIPILGYSGVEVGFKKAQEKEGNHSIRNIDFIYVVNLDERPQKWASTFGQLASFGITPYRFSAVNGWELPLSVIDEIGVKFKKKEHEARFATCYLQEGRVTRHDEMMSVDGRSYFGYDMSLGMIGCALSHLSILQDAYDSGYETIWVMEDDIEVIANPHLMSDYIEELDQIVGKKNWDILFTDKNTKNKQGEYVICLSHGWRPNFTPSNPKLFSVKEEVGDHFFRIGARYGTYSMILRRSGIKKILNFVKRFHLFLPFDLEMTLPPRIQLYTVRDDVISTEPQALTDVAYPGYLQK